MAMKYEYNKLFFACLAIFMNSSHRKNSGFIFEPIQKLTN